MLYTLAEGLRVVSVLLHPFMPDSAERLLAALGQEDLGLERAELGAVDGGARIGELGPALPEGRAPRRRPPEAGAVIDTHCHLDACEPPVAELVGRARAAGVDAAGDRRDGRRVDRARARRRPRTTTRWSRSSGRHPHETAGFDELALEEIERAAAHPRARAIGETGLDYYRDHAPRADQRRAFEAQLELAARAGLPVVIHTRAAEDDTFAMLREHAGSLPAVILHCFSAPDRLEECVERRLRVLVRGQRDVPEGDRPPGGGPRAAGRAPAGGDRFALPRAAAVRGKPNEPANVAHTARFVAELRGVEYEELERTGRRERGARPRAGDAARRARRAFAGCASSASAPTASSARTS